MPLQRPFPMTCPYVCNSEVAKQLQTRCALPVADHDVVVDEGCPKWIKSWKTRLPKCAVTQVDLRVLARGGCATTREHKHVGEVR